jgi:molybdopterin-guanine dinucleotide biosynthesis protein A
MTREVEVVGCILAGGKSSRMGSDKCFLVFDGLSLIERAVNLLRAVFSTVVVSSDKQKELAFLNIPIVPDIRKDCGPLGGIHAAFVHTGAARLFVLACDMPFVSADLIRHIVAHASAGATVPTMNGRVQPLCGLYERNCLPAIERALEEERFTVRNIVDELNPTFVTLTPELSFFSPDLLDNLNAPHDVERALRFAGRVSIKQQQHPQGKL